MTETLEVVGCIYMLLFGLGNYVNYDLSSRFAKTSMNTYRETFIQGWGFGNTHSDGYGRFSAPGGNWVPRGSTPISWKFSARRCTLQRMPFWLKVIQWQTLQLSVWGVHLRQMVGSEIKQLHFRYGNPGTNISHPKAVGTMSFLSNWWDMYGHVSVLKELIFKYQSTPIWGVISWGRQTTEWLFQFEVSLQN